MRSLLHDFNELILLLLFLSLVIFLIIVDWLCPFNHFWWLQVSPVV